MKRIFTKSEILSHRGCYDKQQVLNLSFINKEEISIRDILHSEIPLKDKQWFVFNSCNLTLKEKQKLVFNLAWIVLSIFEKQYSEDKKIEACLESAEKFILGEITRMHLITYRIAANHVAYDTAANTYADTTFVRAADITYARAYANAACAYIGTTKFTETLEQFFN